LDDATFPKIGVPVLVQSAWLSITLFSVFILITFLIVIRVVFPFSPVLDGSGTIGGALLMGFMVSVWPILLPQLIVVLLIGIIVLLYAVYLKHRSRIVIQDVCSIATISSKLAKLQLRSRASFLSAPQSLLVTVNPDCWKDSVVGLSKSASAVIMDISEFSGNLEWEIENIVRVRAQRCILIGNEARVSTSTLDYLRSIELKSLVLLYRDDTSGKKSLGLEISDFLDSLPNVGQRGRP
jgi:hypothetical protein